MGKGWVYVVSNPDIIGKIKIGYTERDPETRIREFEQAGLPSSYELEYQILVDNPYKLEQSVHSCLRKYRENKEWFNCTLEEAVAAILKNYRGHIYLEIDNHNLRIEADRINDARKKKQEEIDAVNKDKQAQIDIESQKKQKANQDFQGELVLTIIGSIGFMAMFFGLISILATGKEGFFSILIGGMVFCISIIIGINTAMDQRRR